MVMRARLTALELRKVSIDPSSFKGHSTVNFKILILLVFRFDISQQNWDSVNNYGYVESLEKSFLSMCR